jgi:hypothetical protein
VTESATVRPELAWLEVADPPERWEALGFAVGGGQFSLGGVNIQLGVDGRGIIAWGIRGIDPATTSIDGLPSTPADSAPADSAPADSTPADSARADSALTGRPLASPHPNGAIELDHVVVVTPDFDRASQALAKAGMPLRRIREVGGDARGAGGSGLERAPFRQGFRRLGPAIFELVESREATVTSFWGLVVIVEDLDALARSLGERLGAIRPAVQPGRQIATLRRSAGLSAAVAFMDPDR